MLKMKKINFSSFLKDLLFTSLTSLITIVSSIILIRLLAQNFSVEEFGAYSLSRRFLATVAPFSTLAMGVALARYVAISKNKLSKNSYFLSGLILGVVPSLIVLTIGLIFIDDLGILIFHDKAYSSLFMATLFMVVGYSFYTVLYSYYRGSAEMGKANLWQLLLVSIGPLAIVFKYAESGKVDFLVFLMGALFFISLFPLSFYIIKSFSQDNQVLQLKYHIKELFKYGLPRVSAGLALSGILYAGIFFAPYFGSLKDAGYLVVGLSMLTIVESGVAAFGIVALPRIAQLYSESKHEFLKERITDIIALVLHFGLFAALHLFLWSDVIVLVWLGGKYTEAIPLMRIIILAIIPYLSYVMLRSVIDAIEERAINTYNLLLSFGITIVISIILASNGMHTLGLAIGTIIGLSILGLLTIFYLWKRYKFRLDTLKIKESLVLNIAFIAVMLLLKQWIILMFKGITQISIIFVIEGMFLLFYFVILWKLKVRWMIELEKRVFSDALQ